jgi:hypothetical protein
MNLMRQKSLLPRYALLHFVSPNPNAAKTGKDIMNLEMIYDLIIFLQILIVAMSVLSGILGGIALNLRAMRAARQIAPVDDGDSSG